MEESSKDLLVSFSLSHYRFSPEQWKPHSIRTSPLPSAVRIGMALQDTALLLCADSSCGHFLLEVGKNRAFDIYNVNSRDCSYTLTPHFLQYLPRPFSLLSLPVCFAFSSVPYSFRTENFVFLKLGAMSFWSKTFPKRHVQRNLKDEQASSR